MSNRLLAAVAAAALVCPLVACSAPESSPASHGSKTNSQDDTSNKNDNQTTPPSTSSSSSSGAPVTNTDPLPTPNPETGACKLPNANGRDLQVKFAQGTPPAATGGKLEGTYVVDDATVYLPGGTNPSKSTGTINGWGIFKAGNYNLSLKVDLTISTLIGNKTAQQTVAGQGTFTTQAEKVVIETSCEGAQKPDVEVSFTDQGTQGTLIVKTQQQGQTVYIALHATKT